MSCRLKTSFPQIQAEGAVQYDHTEMSISDDTDHHETNSRMGIAFWYKDGQLDVFRLVHERYENVRKCTKLQEISPHDISLIMA